METEKELEKVKSQIKLAKDYIYETIKGDKDGRDDGTPLDILLRILEKNVTTQCSLCDEWFKTEIPVEDWDPECELIDVQPPKEECPECKNESELQEEPSDE